MKKDTRKKLMVAGAVLLGFAAYNRFMGPKDNRPRMTSNEFANPTPTGDGLDYRTAPIAYGASAGATNS